MNTQPKGMLVPTTAISSSAMTDEQIARCQRIINEQTALYPTTKGAMVIVADLERHKTIPLYQPAFDSEIIRSRLLVYRANMSTADALRTLDRATGLLYDVVDEALGIYLSAVMD